MENCESFKSFNYIYIDKGKERDRARKGRACERKSEK